MQRAKDYVEHLKRKPVHVREQIALVSAAAVTAVVALGYLAALTSSGSLVIDNKAPQVADAAPSSASQDFSSLVGAAAAFSANPLGEGKLEVVESNTSSTLEQHDTSSATVIPF